MYKRFERKLLLCLIYATGALTLVAICSLLPSYPQAWGSTSDLFGTAGLLAALTGFVQLDVAGLFEQLIQHYSDEEEYPGGPPSRITREIIDNPDRPVATSIRNHLFFRPKTGFWLVILGTALQIVSLWT